MWAAIYVLWMYQRTMTGPPDPGAGSLVEPGDGGARVETADLTRVEVAVLAPLVAALLFFGFVPAPLLHLANPVSTVLNSAGVAR